MKKIIILVDLYNQNTYEFEKKNIEFLSKYLENIIIINIGFIVKSNKVNYQNEFNSKFKIHSPKSILELKELFLINDYPVLKCFSNDIKFFKINFFLSKVKNKIFVISNLGYQPQNFNYINQKIKYNFKFFISQRLKYYFSRLLILINIYPKIDFFFESSEFIIEGIKKGFSEKLKKSIFGIDLSYYKKVIKINSRAWDNHFYQKFQKNEKYIVFIDGMIFDHPDRIMREGPVNLENRSIYYKQMNKLLSHLANKYNKEIIICLHPKNNESEFKKDFKEFKCVKYQTDKYINQSFLVLFHEGSSIIEAILLKKKIINIDGKSLGSYINNRASLYRKLLNLRKIDFDDYLNEIEKIDIKELDNNFTNYDEYIKKNIVFDKSVSGVYQVVDYLKKSSF